MGGHTLELRLRRRRLLALRSPLLGGWEPERASSAATQGACFGVGVPALLLP